MSTDAGAQAQVGTGSEPLWFLGTLMRIKVDGTQTGGRFSLTDGVLPRGAAPPLHSHPQDETLYLIEGQLTVWVLDAEEAASDRSDSPAWVERHARQCGPGSVVFAPAATPHTFRVESDTARAVVLSTPAGLEEYFRALGEPAQWPWLQPPADGPRVPIDRIEAVERELGIVRHGPPPPPLERP
jgi:quercetin dioxygenase-like cupin family protein